MMEKLSLRMIAVGMLACILLWAGAAELFQKPVIPSPAQVFFRLTATFTGTIAIHAAYSLMRIAVGVLAAVAVGYPLGILMGYFRRVNHLLAPILYLTYP
ncbi:MAG: ABC transporter permease, partial [Selenomonas sp.]|nr:ABC transporter permease [Selenomonas sp.]